MKAIVCTKYGPPDVLQLQEMHKPPAGNNEVCIKIFAKVVPSSDCLIRGSKVPLRLWLPMRLVIGFTKPRNPILGMVFAGEVESAGTEVTRFQKGNPVYAFNIRCGTYAQYTCLPENSVMAFKPSTVTYEEAAAVPYGGLLALHFLRKSQIQGGKKVLIYGASGAVGTSAIQLAKHFGAEGTGVCSTTNLELVKSLGADTVIDYTKEDFTNSGVYYDLISYAVLCLKKSQLASKEQCQKALTPDGIYGSVDDSLPKLQLEGLILLKELAEAGQLKPVIDRSYPLEQIVEAHRYVDQGHKKGNVVITV